MQPPQQTLQRTAVDTEHPGQQLLREALIAQLSRLEMALPGMFGSHMHESEFWVEFSEIARAIVKAARPEDLEFVHARLEAMLIKRGVASDSAAETVPLKFGRRPTSCGETSFNESVTLQVAGYRQWIGTSGLDRIAKLTWRAPLLHGIGPNFI